MKRKSLPRKPVDPLPLSITWPPQAQCANDSPGANPRGYMCTKCGCAIYPVKPN